MNSFGVNDEADRGASRGRGRGAWAPKQEEMRRPLQQPSQSHHEASKTDMVKNSTLSPEAKEFVPSTFLPSQQMNTQNPNTNYSAQNRIAAARGQNSYQNNSYQNQQMMHPYYQDNQYNQFDQHRDPAHDHSMANQRKKHEPVTDLNITVSQLESSIKVLTMSPGEFDRLVSHLVDIINPFLESPSQLKEIVSLIIKQSILEGNFRYNGARLCTYLDTVASPSETRAASTFRSMLLQQCEEEREQQSAIWEKSLKHSDEEEKKCHGLILFLAELVTQMTGSASNLGKMLIQFISTVLKNPGTNSAKTICQALKLAGQTLERGNASPRKDMETVMGQLSNLVLSDTVDIHVKRMVDSVTELRNNSWGRAPTITPTYRPPVAPQNAPSQSHEAFDEPVFYGPDGQVISAEESAFLHNFAEDTKQDTNEDYNSEEFSQEQQEIEDEDDVIAAAYEEFLQMSGEKSIQGKN